MQEKGATGCSLTSGKLHPAMAQEHPITPPPELAAQWVAEIYGDPTIPLHPITLQLVERAAQWGADQELEACCELTRDNDGYDAALALRADRRGRDGHY